VREERALEVTVPASVSRIADARCQVLVRTYGRMAANGILDMTGFARSCYLQGFCDRHNGAAPGREKEK
jgi:hypothetical protein